MTTVAEIAEVLNQIAPLELAEDWDNVGLLLGDPAEEVSRVMTCLTITPQSVDEAVAEGAQLVVSHHPILFKPAQRITADDPAGRLVWRLARAGVSVLSAHTAFDSAQHGINQQLAERLGLDDIQPLSPSEQHPRAGTGRVGTLPDTLTLPEFCDAVISRLGLNGLEFVGPDTARVRRVGVGCGSAASLLSLAQRARCEVFLTGEARFHDCLAAEAVDLPLVLVGHDASERFAQQQLAEELANRCPGVTVWASRRETDPLRRRLAP